ncbi:MAG: serine/threonine-protein phosphatase [Proteobacteria bacterium]|nr:serine/threonine-protein phosphatase [Pseudomonadota bacterium]
MIHLFVNPFLAHCPYLIDVCWVTESFFMYLEIAKLSKIGKRKVNEDACDYWLTSNLACCVLSDGLGGHFGGDVASQLVVSSAHDRFHQQPECSARAIELLLDTADDAIVRKQQKNKELKEMRATAVILIVDAANRRATWGHIGDSRLYCFRKGRIILQTRDHSISQSMVDAGYLRHEELRASPVRNQLYAALGNGDRSEAEILSAEFSIQDEDVFLMCSDGLWECVDEREMERMLNLAPSASGWLAALEKQVLLRGNQRQDNYSAIALWCKDSGDKTLMPS